MEVGFGRGVGRKGNGMTDFVLMGAALGEAHIVGFGAGGVGRCGGIAAVRRGRHTGAFRAFRRAQMPLVRGARRGAAAGHACQQADRQP